VKVIEVLKNIAVPLDLIDVGERRRKDYGDIGALAKGIKRVLLQAIVVDRNGVKGRYRLVAGERRLRAARMLKWETIPARLLEDLTKTELEELELEENENRQNLLENERSFNNSKRLVKSAEKAAGILMQAASEKTGKRGQPAKPDSTRSVAAVLGVDQSTVVRAGQHVATAERFPFMQAGDWKQSDVLRVRERMEELDGKAREQTAAIIGTAKVLDPELTVTLVENLGAKTQAERQEIFDLSQSKDPRERSLALTKAADTPPMPDPRLGILDNALGFLNRAITPYPNDPLTPRLIEVRRELKAIRAAVKEVSYDAQRQQQGATVQ